MNTNQTEAVMGERTAARRIPIHTAESTIWTPSFEEVSRLAGLPLPFDGTLEAIECERQELDERDDEDAQRKLARRLRDEEEEHQAEQERANEDDRDFRDVGLCDVETVAERNA